MRAVVGIVLSALVLSFLSSAGAQKATRSIQSAVPALYWTAGVETADLLKQNGIEIIAAPPDKASAWRAAGIKVLPMSEQELGAREKLPIPRIAGRSNVASATTRPWIDSNGWRYTRNSAGKFYYDLTQNAKGRSPLAAAEALAYGGDAVLKIDTANLAEYGDFLKFARELPIVNYQSIGDIGVIDNRSDEMGEVLNLLTRRNLLFRIVPAPSTKYRVNIKLGTKEYPESAAANPSEFAQSIRRKLGDEHRSLRIYGTETVIGRLTGDGKNFRLHLLNYTGNNIEGLRVRILHASGEGGKSWAYGVGVFTPEIPVKESGVYEFSVPKMGAYAVIDGARTK
jgi:hypothetical protein